MSSLDFHVHMHKHPPTHQMLSPTMNRAIRHTVLKPIQVHRPEILRADKSRGRKELPLPGTKGGETGNGIIMNMKFSFRIIKT